ncbi:MAG: glycosyltransferase family 2 protein [Candidatus Portnoybacteria bacterium]
MSENNPLVSINLLTWNGEKYIKDCLKSVLNQNYPNLEILVVDNGSIDNTLEYVREVEEKKKSLRIVFTYPKNIGFSAGHNHLISESKGKYILCLNQDVILDDNFVKEAVEILEKDRRIGSVQGKLLRWQVGMPTSQKPKGYQVSHVIDTTGLVCLKNRRIISRRQGQLDQDKAEKKEEIFGADGAAPVYRREALEDVALNGEYFDEDFFAYKEDVDLAWRLRLRGWKTFYQPKSIAWHDRTAGDNMVRNYLAVIKERLKISRFGKYLAFKNGRLLQIKNEQPGILITHLPWFLPKEIGAWGYVILFERYTWRAIRDLFRQMPSAFRKRKLIMANKKVSSREMRKWFK